MKATVSHRPGDEIPRKKLPPEKGGVAPRSTLAIAGKQRPPKIEKLAGDEVPPPEAAARKRARRRKSP